MTSVPTTLYTHGRFPGMTTHSTTSTLRSTTSTHNTSVLFSSISSKMWIKLERVSLMSSSPTSGYSPQRGIRSIPHGTIWWVSRHVFVALSCLVAIPALTVEQQTAPHRYVVIPRLGLYGNISLPFRQYCLLLMGNWLHILPVGVEGIPFV